MKITLRALSLLALALSIGGCGSTACVSSCGVLASPPPALMLSEKDFGATVSAVPGQSVEVHLTDRHPFPGSSTTWTVTSAEPSALAPNGETRTSSGPARDGSYVAVFTARRRATTKLIAAGRTSCEAMQKSACPDRSEQILVEIR